MTERVVLDRLDNMQAAPSADVAILCSKRGRFSDREKRGSIGRVSDRLTVSIVRSSTSEASLSMMLDEVCASLWAGLVMGALGSGVPPSDDEARLRLERRALANRMCEQGEVE